MARQWTEIDRLKIDQGWAYIAHIDQIIKLRAEAKDELARIESMSSIGAMRYDRDLVKTSPSDDAMLDAVIEREKVSDLEYLIRQLDEEYARFMLDLMLFGQRSDGGHFFYVHYKFGYDYKEIAAAADIDPSTERDMRKKALIEMYDEGLIPKAYRIPEYKAI